MQTVGNIIVVFFSAFFVNYLNAMYMKKVAVNKMLAAAIYGEMVVLAAAIVTINYIGSHWMLLPAIIGGFLGTLLTNKITKLLNIK